MLAIVFLLKSRHALDIKPLQPELRNMMGQVAGLARDWASMHEVLQENVAILDDLAENGLAAISLASMYHKIGHNYIKVRVHQGSFLFSFYILFSFLFVM